MQLCQTRLLHLQQPADNYKNNNYNSTVNCTGNYDIKEIIGSDDDDRSDDRSDGVQPLHHIAEL